MGERAAIKRIRGTYGYDWPDSDCSYIPMGSKYLLITTDSIAERTHIPKGAKPQDVGYFFAALNLSDIAAMGGRPKYFMSALVLPNKMDIGYLDGLQRGINRCLRKYNVKLIGGDLKKGTEAVLTGVAIGEAHRSRMMHRMNIGAGDAVCVTGTLGRNAAGYYMWKRGESEGASILLGIEPRIKEGMFISTNGARAAIDLSDGVNSAISQISAATGKHFEILWDAVPADPLALNLSKRLGINAQEMCLNFGGEYELLFTVPHDLAEKLASKARAKGMKVSVIGRVYGRRNVLVHKGRRIPITGKGYEHFISD